jgi:hypothetical protein
MTWMELYLLLKSMAEQKHTSLCDTPAQRVTAIVGDGMYYLDLIESMTTGELHFVQSFASSSDEDDTDGS